MLAACYPFGHDGAAPYKIVLEAMSLKYGLHCGEENPWQHGPHVYSVAYLLQQRGLLRDNINVQDERRNTARGLATILLRDRARVRA